MPAEYIAWIVVEFSQLFKIRRWRTSVAGGENYDCVFTEAFFVNPREENPISSLTFSVKLGIYFKTVWI